MSFGSDQRFVHLFRRDSLEMGQLIGLRRPTLDHQAALAEASIPRVSATFIRR
jgi:hypothetical protein